MKNQETEPYFNQFILLTFVYSSVENTVYVTTMSIDGTPRRARIELQLNDGSILIAKHEFEYRSNPQLTDIRPRNHLTV